MDQYQSRNLYADLLPHAEFIPEEADKWWAWIKMNLPRCVEAFSLPGPEVRFNLELEDPIQAYLPEHSNWKGCGGDWIITLGDTSSAVSGRDSDLPTMKTTVGAFTRLWLGVSAVSGLAITDSIDAPGELLGRLDQLIRLPRPLTDWDY